MGLSVPEQRHLEAVGVNVDHIVRRIANGAQYRVWELCNPQEPQVRKVVKAPLPDVSADFQSQTVGRLLRPTLEAARRQYEACLRHFDRYVLPTEFPQDGNGRYCQMQDFQEFVPLDKPLFDASAWVRWQLKDLVERNNALIQHEGMIVDLTGWHLQKFLRLLGYGVPYLENVGVLPDSNDLVLFDNGLYSSRNVLLRGVQRWNLGKFGLTYG